MNVFGIFRSIEHDIVVGAKDAWHVIDVLGHDVDLIVVDAIKAAQLLGIDRTQLLAGIAHADGIVKSDVAAALDAADNVAVGILQHNVLVDKIAQTFPALKVPMANEIALIASRIFGSGSTKVPALIDKGLQIIEQQAGLLAAPAVAAN